MKLLKSNMFFLTAHLEISFFLESITYKNMYKIAILVTY